MLSLAVSEVLVMLFVRLYECLQVLVHGSRDTISHAAVAETREPPGILAKRFT